MSPSSSQPKINTEELQPDSFSLIRERLKEFQEASEVVLKTEREKEDLRALLSDPALIQNTIAFLNQTQSRGKKLDLWMSERIDAIDYLDAALKWKENPMRHEMGAEIAHFIGAVKPSENATSEEKKMIYGDQMSLFMSLRAYDEERANRLRESGLKKKLIRFADNFYHQQIRDRGR